MSPTRPVRDLRLRAAQVGLDALSKARAWGQPPGEDRRGAVLDQELRTGLGTFSFNAAGDTSLIAYGLYKFDSKGVEVF